MTGVFGCGHERTPENTTTKNRCQTCQRAYHRQWRADVKAGRRRPSPAPLTLAERIERRTQPGTGGCLIWTGTCDSDGYPKLIETTAPGKRRQRPVHRVYWELTVGPLPEGAALARMNGCTNRRCINPEHLVRVNGQHIAAVVASLSARGMGLEDGKFGCGHPKTPENSESRPDKSWLRCRTCRTEYAKARYAAQQLTPEQTAALRARQRAYYHRNRERINATNRARRQKQMELAA